MKTTSYGRAGSAVATALLAHILIVSPAASPAAVRQAAARPERTGEQLYLAACAACHGVRGTGVDSTRLGYDLPLPDFTDCSFATREPDSDWYAVAHDGGPARAFSRRMPAYGDALTSAELGRILDHMRGFCRSKAWPRGELNLPRPLVTEKAFPEDEAVISGAITAEGESSVVNRLVYERRFGARNQFELAVPFGWKEQGSTPLLAPGAGRWIGGLGDIAFGAKRTLHHSLEKGSIFSLGGELVLPTGDRDRGFGKGTAVFEPFASFGQILPSEFFLHAQAGAEFPFNRERAEREAFWRGVLGRSFDQKHFGRSWSPMVEFLGARELVRGEKIAWDLVPQMQVTLSRRQHIMMSFGVRVPLTDRGPRQTEVLFYLLWDWFDGGLFQGW